MLLTDSSPSSSLYLAFTLYSGLPGGVKFPVLSCQPHVISRQMQPASHPLATFLVVMQTIGFVCDHYFFWFINWGLSFYTKRIVRHIQECGLLKVEFMNASANCICFLANNPFFRKAREKYWINKYRATKFGGNKKKSSRSQEKRNLRVFHIKSTSIPPFFWEDFSFYVQCSKSAPWLRSPSK